MDVPFAAVALSQSLQAWAGPVQAIATVLVLPILLLYVRKAWQTAGASGRLAASAAEAAEATKIATLQSQETLRELQTARAVEAAPYVIAYLDVTEEHLVYAVARNIGRTPARDVSINFDPSLADAADGRGRWDLPAFLTNTIPFFPPQYELRSILGVSLDLFAPDSQAPMEYRTSVRYTDAVTQAVHDDNYTLDLSIFRNARSGRATTLTDIHAILQQVGQEQRSLADGLDVVRDLLGDPASRGETNSAADIAVTTSQFAASNAVDPAQGETAAVKAAVLTVRENAEPPSHAEPSDNTEPPDPAEPSHNAEPADARPDANRLREICLTWRSLTERRRWESAGLLQQRLREPPPNGSATGNVFAEVLQHRFYLDGGESLRAFDRAVDRLLDNLETV